MQQTDLAGLGKFVHVGIVAVKNVSANLLQMGQILQSVENGFRMAASEGRGAHAVN